jgi:hypothetical protein
MVLLGENKRKQQNFRNFWLLMHKTAQSGQRNSAQSEQLKKG